jgi:Lipase (class 3)
MTARSSLEALPLARTVCDLIADPEQEPTAVSDTLGVATCHLPFGPILVLYDALHPVDWLPRVAIADGSIREAFYNPVAEALVRSIAAERGTHGDMRGTLFLAGHGLAGALAALTAFDLTRDGQKVLLLTFGQPAVVGPDEAAPELRGWLRFVEAGDAIPNLLDGYDHPTQPEILGDPIAGHSLTLDGLLSRIERTRAARRSEDRGLSSLAQSVEGLEPGLAAHRLQHYRAEIARQDRLRTVPLPPLEASIRLSAADEGTAASAPVPRRPSSTSASIVSDKLLAGRGTISA